MSKLSERIKNFESIYGFTPDQFSEFKDSMDIPGLTPNPPRPVEASPSSSQIPNPGENRPDALINFYNTIVEKYVTLNPESELPEGVATNEVGTETYSDEDIQNYINQLDNSESLSEKDQLVLMLIIAAMRLGNRTAVEYWQSKLSE